MNTKKAIIVTSFGTSYNETRQKTLDRIEGDIAKNFPDWDVRRAYTSKMVIKKLANRDGMIVDYIDKAIERLIDEGYTDVIVQPTLIMNGIEYEDIVRISKGYRDSFNMLSVGAPLLSDEEDFDEMTQIITEDIRADANSLSGSEPLLVLMGHGTEHYANGAFPELYLKLQLGGHRDVAVTTVEGFPRFEDLGKMIEGHDGKDAVVAPLMIVAGDHVLNDMAGDSPESLKSLMEGMGYTTKPLIKGLAEYGSVRRMFIRHVEEAMKKD